MNPLLIYALSVYFVYHVVSRSDILAAPRGWLVRRLPRWITYPLSCAFCFTFWTGILLTILSVITAGESIIVTALIIAPVINFLIDLPVRSALKYLNDPAS